MYKNEIIYVCVCVCVCVPIYKKLHVLLPTFEYDISLYELFLIVNPRRIMTGVNPTNFFIQL